ncbi:MAG: tRNA preQ1(34) S-adenosylmethionine ribosyltransferase-isomerase QueA [Deltaproteobacteria bacterium]|nr:tRNA preQ1(34) S-adenosylmethionine ribosyltransferase-isomerase QueA [Deltaproteobacteria bacterium]
MVASYRFELPERLIAQRPLAERSASRMLVLRAAAPAPEHRTVRDLPSLLDAGDLVVVNDTSVVPARLYGEKAGTGGRVELLLVREHGERSTWVCLLNASKGPRPGTRLVFGTGAVHSLDAFFATVQGPVDDEPGAFVVRFEGDPLGFARAYGHVPLPPYIGRDDDEGDVTRYQTVFADEAKAGSSAAPTAGLHFDAALLGALEARGVKTARVTLHVGPGTFLPMRGERLSAHRMHAEPWSVSEETARLVADTKRAGRRVIAVGTTSLRALEASAGDSGEVRAGAGLTRLFLRPPASPRVVDALVTNFHLPGSTLFALVCAVAGRARMAAAYAAAIEASYRFYSYGDACFLEVVR